jgi:hypothetical protein
MSDFARDILDFQTQLVHALQSVLLLGGIFVGFGLIVSKSAGGNDGGYQIGYRIQRLGLQAVMASGAVIIFHLFLINAYDNRPPILILLGLYAISGLLLLQGLLNLLFGPRVGTGVIGNLLTSLILAMIGVAFFSR